MPSPVVINKAHARRFLLAHLRLLPPRKLRGKQGVLDYIRHVNCIQYDPINIVGQNPHLVLQSRVGGYKPAMLDALLYGDRQLVDGFDKQMSIYPVEDWPQFAYHRVGTRRYFDLTERLLPPELVRAPKPHASQEDYLEWHIYRRAGGLRREPPRQAECSLDRPAG